MPSDEQPKKRMPSAEEISAYVEASAARTKKRLPLAFAKPAPAAEKQRPRALPTTKAARPALHGEGEPASAEPEIRGEQGSPAWQPPSGEGERD